MLPANSESPLTRTVTHTVWAMYGMVGAGTEQKPHRHQSIALDLIVECDPGCYSLVGRELDGDDNIVDATRVKRGAGIGVRAPPGYCYAHVNASGRRA